MPINLSGLIFGQIMPDNSGGPEFDADLDGTASMEDEFVSVINTNATALDVSGWEIWSISAGSGAPIAPTSGLYHEFPASTTLDPDETLWIINEVTGTRAYAQESSEGGTGTNLLTEGSAPGTDVEAVALLNPVTGEYIVFSMSTATPDFTTLTGFTGTTNLGTIDGHSIQDDAGAGFSYQYDAATDDYVYLAAFIPCFAQGTLIETVNGPVAIEELKAGDRVMTLDSGDKPIRWIGSTHLKFGNASLEDQRPIEFKPGSLGSKRPSQTLVVSPQHRMLMHRFDDSEVLAPAAGLTDRPHVRVKEGVKAVTYYHLLLPKHEIIFANGVPTESFYPGEQAVKALPVKHMLTVSALYPSHKSLPKKARPFMSVQAALRARSTKLRPSKASLCYQD